ncbi:hypothetical protein LUB13_09090, partial [Lactobacillus delbrueckii subsp. lactis]|uniref:hypothetical protein n=1 Tax=Lactobacillus delbrueckii TaxID=1584 RepID=UPI001E53C852
FFYCLFSIYTRIYTEPFFGKILPSQKKIATFGVLVSGGGKKKGGPCGSCRQSPANAGRSS